ncbi:uncharacterized protein MELLADRAFT_116438, partial [Melampsora larici-populina 98AG31]
MNEVYEDADIDLVLPLHFHTITTLRSQAAEIPGTRVRHQYLLSSIHGRQNRITDIPIVVATPATSPGLECKIVYRLRASVLCIHTDNTIILFPDPADTIKLGNFALTRRSTANKTVAIGTGLIIGCSVLFPDDHDRETWIFT